MELMSHHDHMVVFFSSIYDCKGYFGYVTIGKIKFSIFSKSC
jgi:hypothetical protein